MRIELRTADRPTLAKAGPRVVVDVAYSDENGLYRFDGLLPGEYLVREIDPMGYESTTSAGVFVTVVAGETSEANFGDRPMPYWLYLPVVLKEAS